MDKIVAFLFQDPQTAGGFGTPETFHFYVPWIIACALGLLVPFYYFVEGRKRFFGSHTLHKALLDRFFNQMWPIALVGWFLIGARYALDSSLFSWRFWRYGWLLWIAIYLGYWIFYMARRYPNDIRWYRRERTLARYRPQPNPKRRAAKAGSR